MGDLIRAVDSWDASTWIALAALALSAWALWGQHRTGGRANFTVEWETDRTLVFANQGPGSARDVTATLQNASRGGVVDVPYLPALQNMRLRPSVGTADVPLGPLVITWRDNRLRQQTVSLSLAERPERASSTPGRNDLEKAVRALALAETRREMTRTARRVSRNLKRG